MLRLWRQEGRLRIELILSGTAVNAFALLDESSTLWTLRHGVRTWQRTADAGTEKLFPVLTVTAAFSTIVTEGAAHG